jgi:hypothetical protein
MYEAFSTFYVKFLVLLVSYGFLIKSFSNHQDQHQAAHLPVVTENQLYSVRFLLMSTIELIQKGERKRFLRFDIQSVASNNRVCMLVMD